MEQMRKTAGVPWTVQCRGAGVPYSSFMRWKSRMGHAMPPVQRTGPKPVGTIDWNRLEEDIRALHHCSSRTRGTQALYEQYRAGISRRDFQTLVLQARH